MQKEEFEKIGIERGSKVKIDICDANGKITETVEGKVVRVFPHNIVLDRGACVASLKGEVEQKGKSYTIPMRWIKSIEETD